MNRLAFQDLKQRYLQKLYELSDGNPYREIKLNELHSHLESSNDRITGVMVQLKKTQLVEYTFLNAMLTPEGIEEVEKHMAKTYAEKELLVLKTIYELSKNSSFNEVHISDLQKAIGLNPTEFVEIINELHDRKKYLGKAHDEHLKLNPAGREFLEQASNYNQGNISNITFHGDVIGFQNQTQNSSQNIQINVNPEFDSAIKSLIGLVKTSSISELDKEECIADIERIRQLAQKDKTPDVIERAQKKISLLKTALEVGELAVKMAPLIDIISKAF